MNNHFESLHKKIETFENKKTEFRKELSTDNPEVKNVVSGGAGGHDSSLKSKDSSATAKPGGKKKIYSINGNVRVPADSDKQQQVGAPIDVIAGLTYFYCSKFVPIFLNWRKLFIANNNNLVWLSLFYNLKLKL